MQNTRTAPSVLNIDYFKLEKNRRFRNIDILLPSLGVRRCGSRGNRRRRRRLRRSSGVTRAPPPVRHRPRARRPLSFNDPAAAAADGPRQCPPCRQTASQPPVVPSTPPASRSRGGYVENPRATAFAFCRVFFFYFFYKHFFVTFYLSPDPRRRVSNSNGVPRGIRPPSSVLGLFLEFFSNAFNWPNASANDRPLPTKKEKSEIKSQCVY